MNKDLQKLPDSELNVMLALWECPIPASRSDIEEHLPTGRAMAPTTLLTLLSRLEDRGFIRSERSGRTLLFYPLVDKKTYQAKRSGGSIRQLFGSDMPAFASALCESGITEEELRELSRLLGEGKL